MNWRPALERPRTRLVRLAGVALLSVALSAAAIGVVLPIAARALVRAIELVANACVVFAMSLSVGASVWSVLAAIGRGLPGWLASRQASAVLTVLVVIAALAA